MREIFKGFLMLRLFAFIPLLMIIVVLVGLSALTGDSDVLVIVVVAGAPAVLLAALGWLMARRAAGRRR
ncbi:MAG TPA: hypothetical protein VGR11_09285 [Solirubrobacteraceae bacterium]|nr:hypothetical protein [Solirubrobacteraceae bacterium]